MKLTAEEKILSVKINSQKEHPFWYLLLMYVKFVKVKEKDMICPTMAVDQNGTIYYCESFVNKMTFEELYGVIIHELSHTNFMHPQRLMNKDRHIWNLAVDITVNHMLLLNGFTLPKDCILPDTYEHSFTFTGDKVTIKDINKRTAEDIYE